MFLRLLLLFLIFYLVYKLILSFTSDNTKSSNSYTNGMRREGDTRVDSATQQKKDKKIDRDEGEYIDYEEV